MKARRYQLRKDALAIVASGHPWLFREQLSTAAGAFRDGEHMKLVDGQNRVVGWGVFEAEGAIAVRMLRRGEAPPDGAWVRAQLAAAIAKRAELAQTTDGLRLVNGESDGLPAVVADRFGDTVVVASYSAGTEGLARYLARIVDGTNVLVRPVHRRRGEGAQRTMRGAPPEIAHFREDGISYAVDLAAGHKTGAYLDLRGLRRAIAQAPLAGKRVLNLFAYTGMLGRAAEAAGAAEIVHVDASARALQFAAAHHVADPARHRFVEADVFDWLPQHAETYDLVIADPPAMTSRKAQVPAALAAYRRLYTAAARLVRPGGALVAACCTSRIERAVFRKTVRNALGEKFAIASELPPEPDHPVGFPQADYLKILTCTKIAQDDKATAS